jgi:flagellar basal body-associated protein FliL
MGIKKSVSTTIIGIILLVVILAIAIMLVAYFGGTANNQSLDLAHKLDIIKGGGTV